MNDHLHSKVGGGGTNECIWGEVPGLCMNDNLNIRGKETVYASFNIKMRNGCIDIHNCLSCLIKKTCLPRHIIKLKKIDVVLVTPPPQEVNAQ